MFSKYKTFRTSKKTFKNRSSFRTKERKGLSKRTLTGLLIVFGVGIVVAVAAAYFAVQEDPIPIPERHVVCIIDLTDGLTAEQYQAFQDEFEYSQNLIKKGDRLSIYQVVEKQHRFNRLLRNDLILFQHEKNKSVFFNSLLNKFPVFYGLLLSDR